MGARPTKDGISTMAFPSGVGSIPVEITEGQCPLWFREKQYLKGSGGEGKFRGGLGQRIVVENREPVPFVISAATFDRIHNPPQGREGGAPGRNGAARLASGATLPDKGLHIVPQGDALVVELPGGGGFGKAEERPQSLRDSDAKAGLV
ncbi:MAG: hydantoinase B/oxoprolinase family protein [Hyphomicrobiales bacterium]